MLKKIIYMIIKRKNKCYCALNSPEIINSNIEKRLKEEQKEWE